MGPFENQSRRIAALELEVSELKRHRQEMKQLLIEHTNSLELISRKVDSNRSEFQIWKYAGTPVTKEEMK
jgi:hypothetical protein